MSPRIATALGAGLAAGVLVALTGRGGVEDNGDGFRLYCGLGLVPDTADGLAAWKGGVVTAFRVVDEPTCGAAVPSSAGLVLRAATSGGALDLAAVGWLYAALVALVVGVAAWAAAASGPWRAAVLIVPVAPLALPWFSRFTVSTYAEPAGLLGTLAVACGVATLLVTHRRDRTALVLTTVGGMVAATAKVAYLPVLVVALAVVVVALGRRGLVVALVAVAVVAVPVVGAVRFQALAYENANVHDIVFTLVLPELGPGVLPPLGLPPEAVALTGTGFFNGPPLPTAPWWREAVLTTPGETRSRAYGELVRRPDAVLRAVGVGLQATTRPDLPYLASVLADPATPSARSGDPAWAGADGPALRSLLAATPGPAWAPTALVGTALLCAALWRRSRWCRAAGLGAVTALGLVAAAVLGDGYFEVFKHVWLAAYVLILTAACLLGALTSASCVGFRRAATLAEPPLGPSALA